MYPFDLFHKIGEGATILILFSLLKNGQTQAYTPNLAYTCCSLQGTFLGSSCSAVQPSSEFELNFHKAIWSIPPRYRKGSTEIQLTLETRNGSKPCATDFRIQQTDFEWRGEDNSHSETGENKTTPLFFANGSMIFGDTTYDPSQYCIDSIVNEGERDGFDIVVFQRDCANPVSGLKTFDDGHTHVPWIKEIFAAVAGLSCLLILVNVIIYLALRNYLNVSGWVEFAYFVALGTFSVLSIPALLYEPSSAEDVDNVCYGLSAALQFFEVAVYSSFMMIAFDVYWMIRKSDAFASYGEDEQESKLKLLVYYFILLSVPTAVTTYGVLLDKGRIDDMDHMLPRYGLKSCSSPSWVLTDYITFGFQSFTFFLILLCVDHIFSRLSKSADVDDAPRVSLLSNLFFFTLTYWIMDLFKFVRPLLSSKQAESNSSKQLWLVLEGFEYAQGVLVFVVFLFNRKTLRALKKKSGSDGTGAFREIFRHACCSSRSGIESPDGSATPMSPLMKTSSMRRSTVRQNHLY